MTLNGHYGVQIMRLSELATEIRKTIEINDEMYVAQGFYFHAV